MQEGTGVVAENMSEEQTRAWLGPRGYAAYTSARVMASIMLDQHKSPSLPESSEDYLPGFFLAGITLVAILLVAWLVEGHPGTFFAWLWQEMLRTIAD